MNERMITMKKQLMAVLMLSGMLVLSACSSSKIPGGNPSTPAESGLPEEKVGADINQPEAPRGITVNKVIYEVLTDNIPEELSQLIEDKKAQKGFMAKEIDGEWYVAVMMGEQSSGGYAVEVTYIEDNEGKTNIIVKETKPAEDDMVTMAITYPYQVVKIKSGIAPNFTVVNEAGEKYDELK